MVASKENDEWQEVQVVTGHINGNALNAKLKKIH